MIEDCRSAYPVRILCDVVEVSPSGYYAWRSRPESPRKVANRHLLDDLRRLSEHHRQRYGAARLDAALRAEGRHLSRRRVERRMQHHGIRAHRSKPFRICTTDRNHSLPGAPNLLNRNFAPAGPNQVWVAGA